MRPGGTVLSQEQQQRLKKLVTESYDAQDISERMDIPIGVVKAEAKRQGLELAIQPGSKWRPQEDETLIELAKQGLSADQIAQQMKPRVAEAVYGRARVLIGQGCDLPLPRLDRRRTQNRASEHEISTGRAGLAAMSLPLNRIAEAFRN